MANSKKEIQIEFVQAQNTEADFQGFLKLEREFNKYYDLLGVGEQYGRIPYDQLSILAYKAEFKEYFKGDNFFIFAKNGDKYVGYTGAHIEEMPRNYKKRLVGCGDALFVSKKYMGTGIGKQLLEKRINWCKSKGATIHQFTVKVKNSAALEFFKRQGFEVDELRLWKKIF